MQTWGKSRICKPKIILSLDTDVVGLEPTSLPQASKNPKWIEAMLEEFNALLANTT